MQICLSSGGFILWGWWSGRLGWGEMVRRNIWEPGWAVSNNIFASLIFTQVLVLVHQVFLDLMTHSFFKLSDAALLIMDECHHAQVITRCLKGNSPNFCYLVSRLQNKGLFFQTLICYSKGLQLLFHYSDPNDNNAIRVTRTIRTAR